MLSSLNSDRRKLFTLLPFGYALATRFATPRDFTYLVVTSWLPGVWLISRLGDHGLGTAALYFAAGYLCFQSVYEFGYFANDAWDAPRTENGRQRIKFAYDRTYLAVFAGIRIGVWIAIGVLTGWIGDGVWLVAFAALIAAFTLHNLVQPAAYRAASFFQLACLRFTIPLIGAVPDDKLLVLLFAAFVFYTYFRFLTYLEGIEKLDMPERKGRGFGLVQTAMLTPFAAFGAYATGEAVLLELLAYFIALYGAYALAARG
jgi:hypothetical protein